MTFSYQFFKCVATMAVLYSISRPALVVAVTIIVASYRSCHGFVKQPVPRSLALLQPTKKTGRRIGAKHLTLLAANKKGSGGFGAKPKRSGKKNKKGGGLQDALNDVPSKKKQVFRE